MASALKPGIGNTAGNKYASPGPHKRIVLPGPDKPPRPRKKKNIVKKAVVPKGPKGGKGKGKKKTTAPGVPAAPAGPYDKYKGTAYEGYFEQQDRDALHHQNYVGNTVMPQLSAGLAALTGVNPAAPGYNPVIQQQYLGNVAGSVGNALNASAAATPASFSSMSPGGVTAAPNAYLGEAMRAYAGQRGGAAIMNAQAQSALNTLQPNIYAQAALSRVADYAKGLPQVYAERRSAEMLKVDQYMAEAAEEARHNKVTEAISGMNAKTNAAIQFGKLGLDTTQEANDQRELTLKQAKEQAENTGQVPYGFVRLPNGNIARDPQVPAASASSSSSSGGNRSSAPDDGTSTRDANHRLRVPVLQEKGYRNTGRKVMPKKIPAGWKAVRGADGNVWILKPGASSSGGSKITTGNMRDSLQKWYIDKIDGKYEPAGAARHVGNWILSRRKRFTKGGKADVPAIRALLEDVIGTGTVNVPQQVGKFLASHIDPKTGRWK